MPEKAQKSAEAAYLSRKKRKKKKLVSLYLTGFYVDGR